MTLEMNDIWKLVTELVSKFWKHAFKGLQDGFPGRDPVGPPDRHWEDCLGGGEKLHGQIHKAAG